MNYLLDLCVIPCIDERAVWKGSETGNKLFIAMLRGVGGFRGRGGFDTKFVGVFRLTERV